MQHQKNINRKITFFSVFTETECQFKSDFAARCNIKDLSNDHSPISIEQESDQSECDFQNEYNCDFIMQEKSCNEFNNEDSNFEPKPPVVAFIVFWSSLLMLLRQCLHPTCFLPAKIKNFSLKDCQLIESLQCSYDHTSFWKSQPDCNCFSVGNLMSAAVVLFSTDTYQRIGSFFQLVNIQWISKTSYYEIQEKYLVGIVNRNYVQHSKEILMTMKRRDNCCLSGDGRCDSPGRNAEYSIYPFMNKETGKIAAMSLTQISEVDNSNQMEKKDLLKHYRCSKTKILPLRRL